MIVVKNVDIFLLQKKFKKQTSTKINDNLWTMKIFD